MKKFLSILLTITMLFSLAMPAMAADTTGEVSATFDPDIAISSITYSGETVTYDENSGNYVYLIPADFSDFETDYIPVIITISGTNLEYAADEEEVLLRVNFHMEDQTQSLTLKLSDAFAEGFAYQNGSLVLDPNTVADGLTMVYSFSNDNGSTWSDPVSLVYKQDYSITASETENGTVTGPAYAPKGNLVYLTVTPDVGYELETLSITGPDGEIPSTKTEDGRYRFTMPAGNVNISATFTERTTEPTTKTIYFDNTEGWENVNAYAWDSTSRLLGEWPGTAMTLAEGETSIYTIEVPADAVNIIFNNNSSAQTPDLTIPTDDKNLYTYSTGEWSVYGSTGGEEPVTFPDPIYLDSRAAIDDSAWNDEVEVHFFDSEGAGIAPFLVMTKIADGLYSLTGIPDNAATICFIDLMDGGITANLTPVEGCNMYVLDGGTDENGYYTGSWTVYDPTEPTAEAKWGTSKDNLTNSGTLDEAFAAAAGDSGITYIQLQTSVTTTSGYDIYSGVFTLDLNGNTLTSDQYGIALRDAAVQVILTDTAAGGAVISKESGSVAVIVSDGGHLVIDGGSYSGTYAVGVFSGSAEINGGTFTASYAVNVSNGAILTINDGTIIGDWTSVITNGTTTINGGTISAGSMGHIEYWGGPLDLSGYDVNNLTLSQLTDNDMTVPNENIKLPEGYVFKDSEGSTVTTLTNGTIYTIGAASTKPTYTITVEIFGEGTVDVPASAAEGDTVTVTLNPDEGYSPLNFQVWNAEDYTLHDFMKVNETTYTFVMPAFNVLITLDFCLPGTTLDTIYYKGPWTNVLFELLNSEGAATGDAVVGTMAEEGIYSASPIPEWSYRLIIRNLDNLNEYIDAGDIPTDVKNMYNAETGQWETYTPSQPPEEVTSADIVWGSMSFTYDDTEDENGDEIGWTADNSESAGTVTVKNTGDTVITAQATYTSYAGYETIIGSFDSDSVGLAPASGEQAGEEYIFTLELNGKPTKAIPAGTKIGQVTITITKGANG